LIGYIICMTENIMKQENSGLPLKFSFSGRIVTADSRHDEIRELTPEQSRWLLHNHHRHEFREIMVVIAGSCVFQLKNKYFNLNAGDIVLLHSMELHTEGHYPDETAVFWWGSFWTDMLRIHLWKENKISDSGILSMGAFNDFMYQIWDEFIPRKEDAVREEIANIMSVLVNHFLRTEHQKKSSLPCNEQCHIMEKIVQYIESMPSLTCTLDSLALLAGYSKVHFQRILIQYTGMTFREYLLRKRVERYFRLAAGNPSLKEVAYELGFSSPAAYLHWKQRNKDAFHL